MLPNIPSKDVQWSLGQGQLILRELLSKNVIGVDLSLSSNKYVKVGCSVCVWCFGGWCFLVWFCCFGFSFQQKKKNKHKCIVLQKTFIFGSANTETVCSCFFFPIHRSARRTA